MKKRDRSLDIFKGFAILIVVVGHALQALLPIEGGFSHQVIRSFQMELFMFTSGMAFSYSYPQKANGETARKLIIRMFPVYLIWGYILYFLMTLASRGEITLQGLLKVLYASGFWYLRYLLLYELYILLIGAILHHIPVLSEKTLLYYILPLLGTAGIWLGTHLPVIKSSMSSPLYFYLVLGICFGSVKDKIGEKWRGIVAGVGIVGMITLIVSHRLLILLPLFAIMAFWGLSVQIAKLPVLSDGMAYLGLRTLQIYAIHVCVLHGPWIETGWYRSIYEKSGMPFVIAVILLSVLWLAICLSAEWLISRNQKLRHFLFAR